MANAYWYCLWAAKAAVPAIVAGFAALIAYQQLQIGRQQAAAAQLQTDNARNKLRLELFDRRFKVFLAARSLFQYLKGNDPDFATADAFKEKIQEAEFLFSSDAHRYFTDLARHLDNLSVIRRTLDKASEKQDEATQAKFSEHDRILRMDILKMENQLVTLLKPSLDVSRIDQK